MLHLHMKLTLWGSQHRLGSQTCLQRTVQTECIALLYRPAAVPDVLKAGG